MRAQASVEYILILILILTGVAVISVASSVKTREIEISSVQQAAETVLGEVGSAINTAYLEGNGFTMNATLPDRIQGFPYAINMTSNFLTVTIEGTAYSKPLLTNATGTLSAGNKAFTNVNGEVRIT